VLPVVGAFYYTGPCPARVETPKLGASYYELRFRNGYVTGIVAPSGSIGSSRTASMTGDSPATFGTRSHASYRGSFGS
jgi:hypothetical protein